MKYRLLGACFLLAFGRCCSGAPTDIVPRGSTLNDAFASLARSGMLSKDLHPSDFLSDTLHTRAQMARLLEPLLRDGAAAAKVQTDANLRATVLELEPELKSDGIAVETLLSNTPKSHAAIDGMLQPELRSSLGGNGTSGTLGIYRIASLGMLSKSWSYGLSVSNWPEDERRVFENDIGSHDFSGVQEAFVAMHGWHDLTFKVGRFHQRWGGGMRGATLLSDNAPPMDQISVEFPFSLGRHLGRNYRYAQMVSTFKENSQQAYFSARRIEYQLTPKWNVDFEEAFKSTSSGSLLGLALPLNFQTTNLEKIIPGSSFSNLDNKFNYVVNLGTSYELTAQTRFYGQFFIDDLRRPFGNPDKVVPRKIAYLVGGSTQTATGTSLTVEYSRVDATTYTSQSDATQWQNGRFDSIGLPSGPNNTELFVRLGQRLTPKITLALEARNRHRLDNSFPAPTSRDLSASAYYEMNRRSGIHLTYHDYRQDPFPFTPGTPGYPIETLTPLDEGNLGQRLRIRELDFAYQFFF